MVAEMSPVASPAASPPAPDGNARPYSVSELAFALKRTLEDAYGFVRLRGELSKVTFPSSGHIYLSLKDDDACLDGVVWRSSVRALKVRPEQGLEVVVTGRITTYPASSKYQIVIESMEAAGVGALLAQLERLKAKLAGEGLFAAERKRPLPRHPAVIGVITSPTGAVIRDILHRVRDRWPMHVLVWPVVVQGEHASAQVAAAIRGFNALDGAGAVPRPEVLVVARGGGSVEDLWPFNDEALARAAAASRIPLISAVGHETDTTLIDFVSDRRAPTPTAAAEMATPVLADLKAQLLGLEARMLRSATHQLESRRTRLTAAARGLGRPEDLLALAAQRLDGASRGLAAGLSRNVAAHERAFAGQAARLGLALLRRPIAAKGERLADLSRRLHQAARRSHARAEQHARLPALQARMAAAIERQLAGASDRLARLEQLRRSLDPDRPLERGFARVHAASGALVHAAAELSPGERVRLVFARDAADAVVQGEAGAAHAPALAAASRPSPKPRAARPAGARALQGDLF